MVCDKDCFHCPYDDCINDDITYEDFKSEQEIDKIIGIRKPMDGRLQAQQKEYYQRNKERIQAQRKEYRECHA